MRCDAVRCDAVRCGAMRCDAMRCDAMRCDAMQLAVHAWAAPCSCTHRRLRDLGRVALLPFWPASLCAVCAVPPGHLTLTLTPSPCCRYSLWLAPSQSSPEYGRLQTRIRAMAVEHGTIPFEPHLTLCPSFSGTQTEAIRLARQVGGSVGSRAWEPPSL